MSIIREIRRKDASEARDLWNEMCEAADAAVPAGWGRLGPASLERIRDNLERWPDHEDSLCLVAEEDGELIGFVTASLSTHPVEPGMGAEVEELYVRTRPDERALKEELAKRAIAWARGRGAGTVRVSVALGAPWSDPEIRFWSDLGFENDITQLNLYDETAGC